MASQEFLASFAVEIDEGGVARLQEVLASNRELAESLAGAFSAASEAIRSFVEELGLLPGFSAAGAVTEGFSGLGGLTLGLDTGAAEKDLQAFLALAKKPVSLSANASGIVSAARSAYNSVRSIFSSPFTLRANVETNAGGDGNGSGGASVPTVQMSAGGRFTRPTDVQVAEDGDAEYIIPVKKEDRAIPLLRQLLGELSPAARESLASGDKAEEAVPEINVKELLPEEPEPESGEKLRMNASQPLPRVRETLQEKQDGGMALNRNPEKEPVGQKAASAGTKEAVPDVSSVFSRLADVLSASLKDVSAPVVQNTSQNVSAPVTIQVRSTGADAGQVGQELYDITERYLLRTLRGVMA